ncbi:hypothetical protein Patl1_05119 [Pistacia atlantica]|uniref:Uncharacterized protein n=1 Tax=Pistacia atlantica TaxID=434234 RepID=A0ACC1BQ97_9ROSI|nr:hypothetical protein Patl1_05119 [Pistacia atlantica]
MRVLASKSKIYMVLEYVTGGELFVRINVLVDSKGNIKISDFGLSALPQHFRMTGYWIQPVEVQTMLHLKFLPIEVMMVLLQIYGRAALSYPNDEDEDIFIDDEAFSMQEAIFKGDAKIPKWLSPGAQNMLRRILEPNPIKQMTMADIKVDEWFKQDYTPADPNDKDEDIFIDDEAFSMQEAV